jgi:hypothetical protein
MNDQSLEMNTKNKSWKKEENHNFIDFSLNRNPSLITIQSYNYEIMI